MRCWRSPARRRRRSRLARIPRDAWTPDVQPHNWPRRGQSASALHEADQRVSIDPRPMAPELRRISSRDGSTRPIFVV